MDKYFYIFKIKLFIIYIGKNSKNTYDSIIKILEIKLKYRLHLIKLIIHK